MAIFIVANGESMDGLGGSVQHFELNGSLQQPLYSRAAYHLQGGDLHQLICSFGAARNRVWHKHMLYSNMGGPLRPHVRFYDGANERLRVALEFNAAGTLMRVETVNGGVVTPLFVTTASFMTYTAASASGQLYSGDFTIDINYQAAGWVRIYKNLTLVGEFIGDPRVGGSVSLSECRLRAPRETNGWGESYYSQIMFADEDLRPVKPVTLYPNAAGTVNTATGAFTDVDEAGESGTDFVQGLAAGQKFSFNMTNLPGALGAVLVRDVIFRARVMGPDGASPTTYRSLVRTGGLEFQGAAVVPPPAWQLAETRYTLNPNTGTAWTNALIDAVEFGAFFEA